MTTTIETKSNTSSRASSYTTTSTKLNEMISIKPPVLCIPRAEACINEACIRNAFHTLNIGIIESTRILENKKNNTSFIIIHFQTWFDNERSRKIKSLLDNGNCFKIIYDFPSFWKCYTYKN